MNNIYDTTFVTHNRFSNFHCAYTNVQVVHTEFIKVFRTDHSAFKSLSKMIQEQGAAAVITVLHYFPRKTSKKKNNKKQKKKRVCVKPWLKRRKNLEFYETLLAELRLKDEYNYNIILRMTSENFEEIFQLIKDDITKENTKLRELIPPRL